jgi:hypothetical protein
MSPHEERPFWHWVHPRSNDWLPELQQAWVAMWTGDAPPRSSAVAIAEGLWDIYNEIARRHRGAPLPPPRTPYQYSFAACEDMDLVVDMLESEALVGITVSDRDRLGITPLLGPASDG